MNISKRQLQVASKIAVGYAFAKVETSTFTSNLKCESISCNKYAIQMQFPM